MKSRASDSIRPATAPARTAGRWWPGAVIAMAAVFVFAPAVRGGWLWDDVTEITGNLLLRSPGGLWKIWFAPPGPDYLPLKSTLEWIQWQCWGPHPLGYHLTTLALHVLAACLVWRLFARLGLRLAWVGGLLFAIHPIAVESVAWIAEQKNTLSLPLLLLAACAYADYGQSGRHIKYVASVVLFLAAMLCKTSVVMFPVVLLVYAWWRRGGLNGRDLWATVPFFALSAGLGCVSLWFQQQHAIGPEVIHVGGAMSRLAIAGPAILFYLEKFLIPSGLMPIYPRWSVASPRWTLFLPWLLLAVVLVWCWRRRAGWGRHALLGLGWFLLNLVPVLGFVTISYLRISWVADHFVYLPLVGLAGLAAAGMGVLMRHLTGAGRRLSWVAFAALAVALAFQGRSYAGIFRGEKTFWQYAVERNPQAWMAQNNLGKALAIAGQPAIAIPHFEAALRLNPDYPEAHNNLGNALFATGRTDEALTQHEAALHLQPDYAEAQFNLANDLCQEGRFLEAIPHYEAGLRLIPDYPQAHDNLGRALVQTGRIAAATAQFETEVRLHPDDALARNNLGNALGQAGRWADAVVQYRAALDLSPDFATAHVNLGITLLHLGRWSEARAEFIRALDLRPDDPRARANLALVDELQSAGAR